MQAALGDRVQLVSIDVDPVSDSPSAVAAFAARWGGDWPRVLDTDHRLLAAFGIQSLDTTIVLDRGGRVVYVAGPQPAGALVQMLKGL